MRRFLLPATIVALLGLMAAPAFANTGPVVTVSEIAATNGCWTTFTFVLYKATDNAASVVKDGSNLMKVGTTQPVVLLWDREAQNGMAACAAFLNEASSHPVGGYLPPAEVTMATLFGARTSPRHESLVN